MLVLSWNLYHGRAVPPARRDLYPAFAAKLAGWAWDAALLQECPPWWPAQLARDCGAHEHHALTARNAWLPLRRFIATRWPDFIKSNGGGCNAILLRGEAGLAQPADHRFAVLRTRPERRVVHAVRLARGRLDRQPARAGLVRGARAGRCGHGGRATCSPGRATRRSCSEETSTRRRRTRRG